MNAWGNLSYALLFEYSLLEAFCVKINTAVFVMYTAVQEGQSTRLRWPWYISYFPCYRLISSSHVDLDNQLTISEQLPRYCFLWYSWSVWPPCMYNRCYWTDRVRSRVLVSLECVSVSFPVWFLGFLCCFFHHSMHWLGRSSPKCTHVASSGPAHNPRDHLK